jgi:hypothetical protein
MTPQEDIRDLFKLLSSHQTVTYLGKQAGNEARVVGIHQGIEQNLQSN